MGTTTAGELLEIYAVRLGMQESGMTNPSASVETFTKLLVDRLSKLDSAELIEIDTSMAPKPWGVFKRTLTGEVLAILDGEETAAEGPQI